MCNSATLYIYVCVRIGVHTGFWYEAGQSQISDSTK